MITGRVWVDPKWFRVAVFEVQGFGVLALHGLQGAGLRVFRASGFTYGCCRVGGSWHRFVGACVAGRFSAV